MSAWDKKLEKAEKFLQASREHGRNVYSRYKDDRQDALMGARKVNIFYSNVNTIKESLFNSLPKPDVSRMQKGDFEDDVSRVAALILQRALHYEVQCAENFKEAVEYAILDRLVPGTGQVWVRFEQPEQVFIDVLYWEDFLYGPARNWDLVPWVARRHELTKEEFIASYGEEAFSQASMVKNDNNTTPKEITDNKYCAYEVWDKKTKTVLHIVKGAERPVKEAPDPYGLPGFFPCPKPLIANPATSAFLAITDYHLAQDQYNELDILYARMSLITKAVKVAGSYDAAEPALGRMLDGSENKLIPVDNWAMYAEKGGAKGMIDWYPIEQIVTVYQGLQQQYEFVKTTLYEVTGMSDIMRGASNQYETASAQKIKAQFASVRMNGYQRNVSHFVRDIMNIMACLMTKLYSDQKFQAICGGFTEADQQLLAPAMQVLRDQTMKMYKIDVEADSLTQSDWALEKESRMELTGYISQFLQAAVPAIQQTPEIAPLLLGMLKFTVAGFKGAAELEGMIDQQLAAILAKAQEPAPEPPPSPEEMKAQAEQQKMQMDAQIKQSQAEMQEQIKRQESQQKMALEEQQARADMAVKEMEMNHKRELFQMEERMMTLELMFKQRESQMKLEAQAASAAIKAQQDEEKEDEERKSSTPD